MYNSITNNAYNRFPNLDSYTDRIIYYLISEKGKTLEQLKRVHTIWKILYYADINALNKELPTQAQISSLVDKGEANKIDKRVFRSPFLEDAWTVQCSMLNIYLDGLFPPDNKVCTVNIGIDILTHNKLTTIYVADDDDSTLIDILPDGTPITVDCKSRVDVLLNSILYLLNGADVSGVGKMQFNGELTRYNQARYSIWNNRNYGGFKLGIGCQCGGLQ